MPTLSDLITRYRDVTGYSYEELSAKSDWVVSRQAFYKLATQHPRQFPKSADTVRAVAHALDTDVTTVTLAYARSLGLDVLHAGSDFTRTQSDAQLVREVARRLGERGSVSGQPASAGRDQGAGATKPAEPAAHPVDELEQARINRGPAPPAMPAAARSDPSRDIEEHTASLRRGEESQDDGGEDPA